MMLTLPYSKKKRNEEKSFLLENVKCKLDEKNSTSYGREKKKNKIKNEGKSFPRVSPIVFLDV